METIYIKRFIKTEDDLPKENGKYYALPCFEEDLLEVDYFGTETSAIYWLHDYVWYLQPTTLAELIKEKLPSDKIEETIRENYDSMFLRLSSMVISDMVKGANIVINKLTE